MKQKNKPAEMVRLEKLNEKMVEIIEDFSCYLFNEMCDDCYFCTHEGKCMMSERTDIDVRKKLVVEWLEKEVKDDETKTN